MQNEMITTEELATMIAALESQQQQLSLKEEKYLKVCKELETRRAGGCNHNWNQLKLAEGLGVYHYCRQCGDKRV